MGSLKSLAARCRYWVKAGMSRSDIVKSIATGLTVLKKETYLQMIRNSPGTELFRSMFVSFNNSEEVDILRDGDYSCAFFVSSILRLCGMQSRTHTTVKSVREVLLYSGDWDQVTGPGACVEPGDVVIWEKIQFEDGSENEHIGFALSRTEAVSTSYKEKKVVRHHLTSGINHDGSPIRRVIAVFRYKF